MVRASDILLIIVGIIFPPAAAAFITGCSCDLLINICLTIYITNLTSFQHSFWLTYKKMQAEEHYGPGGFIYIGSGQYQPLNNQAYPAAPAYGSVHQG
ncbi:hypothetical protein J3R82DRAFT_517 [Butyriboletus roseoflavus]|nr:hypothetical protein J3R82DRAFT_517 [Butyriboletus roseoflavus]